MLITGGRSKHHHPNRRADRNQTRHRRDNRQNFVNRTECRRGGSCHWRRTLLARGRTLGDRSRSAGARSGRSWRSGMSSWRSRRGSDSSPGTRRASRRQCGQFDRRRRRGLRRQIDADGFLLGLDLAGFLLRRNGATRDIGNIVGHIWIQDNLRRLAVKLLFQKEKTDRGGKSIRSGNENRAGQRRSRRS